MRTSRHSERSTAQSRNDRALRSALAKWFRTNKRDLPWRRTCDPYAILVSEIMLQQTTVATVIPYYNRWLRRFPTLRSLARATESQVLHAWQGLGYYSRARNLHRCAKMSVTRFCASLPTEISELRALPGIGRYSANAVGVFAFNQSLPIVEANTARVLARLFNIRESVDTTVAREKLWNASARLVPKSGAREFQSAMMDLGALVCTARQPRCGICPIKNFCTAPAPSSIPVKRSGHAIVSLTESHALIRRGNAILLEQCRTRWRGMWMLPSTISQSVDSIYTAPFPFTHHRITLRVFRAKVRRRKPHERWFSGSQLNTIPVPSPHRRALDALLQTPPRDSSTSLPMTLTMRP